MRRQRCVADRRVSWVLRLPSWPSGYGRGTRWLEATEAGGREFDPRPGHCSRTSVQSKQATGTVFSSEYAFLSKL